MSSSAKSSVSSCSEDDNNNQLLLRRGPWTLQEDNLLIHFISHHGEGRWNLLAKRSGLRRTGKSCRLRWLNYLKPDVKRGNLSAQEQLLILDLHSRWGNRWSKIAQYLPGRTDNEIKNYWRTRVQKQARYLKIDTNSQAFQEIIRCYWIPRLLQKINESSTLILSPPMLPPPPTTTTLPGPPSSSEEAAPPAGPGLLVSQSSEAIPEQATTNFQVPLQEMMLHFNESSLLNSLKEEEKDYNTQSCCISSSSSSSQQTTQVSDYPTHHNNQNLSTFMKDWHHQYHRADNYNGYGLEPATGLMNSVTGDFSYPVDQCHVVESNWMDSDFVNGSYVSNMDELWHFRN